MLAIHLALAIALTSPNNSAPCDVLLWEMTGKGEDSIIYSLNHKVIGRGDNALRRCITAIEESGAPHLVILHGAFGDSPPTGDKDLVERLNEVRKSRGATCLYDLRDRRPVVATITEGNRGILVSVDGEVQNIAFHELRKVPAVKRAGDARAAIVLVVKASLASQNAATAEEVRLTCAFLTDDFRANFIRVDVPSAKERSGYPATRNSPSAVSTAPACNTNRVGRRIQAGNNVAAAPLHTRDKHDSSNRELLPLGVCSGSPGCRRALWPTGIG